MINVSKGWNEKQKNLNVFLPNQKTFVKGIKLLLEMHSMLHDKKVYKITSETCYNDLWEDMKEETCKIISNKETSVLWNIWHITRIEDIVSNMLIGNKETIFNKELQTKLGVKIKDTGNAMTYSEIELLNKNINIKELKEYRVQVGKSTKKIIEALEFNDIKRKAEKEQLEKIKQNGGVTDDPKSIWLLDFWGKKNVLGLIMMPITRHQVVHLNDCFKIKQKYNGLVRQPGWLSHKSCGFLG
ncbi:MAG: hypothetical protein LBV17_02380 [Treponema sp.]|jgi:hypothetical protein|nr:hypothetical protein [Treponema sp.]